MNKGEKLIYYAGGGGQTEDVEKLVKGGVDVDWQDDKGDTALMKAAVEGFWDVVDVLLSHKADPNIQNNSGETALILATSYSDENYPKIIELLSSHGADLNLKNSEGQTALMIAARDGKLECAKLLVKNGANLRERDGMGANWSALDYAKSIGHSELVELLK
jgi:ankyrin repeat protein